MKKPTGKRESWQSYHHFPTTHRNASLLHLPWHARRHFSQTSDYSNLRPPHPTPALQTGIISLDGDGNERRTRFPGEFRVFLALAAPTMLVSTQMVATMRRLQRVKRQGRPLLPFLRRTLFCRSSETPDANWQLIVSKKKKKKYIKIKLNLSFFIYFFILFIFYRTAFIVNNWRCQV